MKKNKVTFGERIEASFLMLIASFLTALFLWGFTFALSSKGGDLFTFPFSFVFYFSGFFVFFAFVAPNKSIDAIGWLWKKIENFLKDAGNGPC